MNKTELVAEMANRTEMTKIDTEKALKAFIDTITEELSNNGRVQLVGFGTFDTKNVAERKGKNPQTGKEIVIPAHTKPHFKAGKALKDAVNNK